MKQALLLLIEDDDADAFLLREAIDSTHFPSQLYHCYDGVEAQNYLSNPENPKPDLILLDLNMPRLDGHGFLKWIKADDDVRDIPVGILTTSSAPADIRDAYKNYASYYITKPSTFEDMESVVKVLDDFWMKTVKLPKS